MQVTSNESWPLPSLLPIIKPAGIGISSLHSLCHLDLLLTQDPITHVRLFGDHRLIVIRLENDISSYYSGGAIYQGVSLILAIDHLD